MARAGKSGADNWKILTTNNVYPYGQGKTPARSLTFNPSQEGFFLDKKSPSCEGLGVWIASTGGGNHPLAGLT